MAERKAISTKRRFDIFKRDNFTCQYCGSTPPSVVLEVDHIVPVARGGKNDTDNLVSACFNCNRGKAANSLQSVPQSLADKAEAVKEAEAQLKGFYKILKKKKDRLEEEAWQVAEIMDPGCSEKGFKIAWRKSILMFLQKLDFYEVMESMDLAKEKKPQGTYSTFMYFCGICWRKIKERDCGQS